MSKQDQVRLNAITDALGGSDEVQDALARGGKLTTKDWIAVLEKDIDRAIAELEANANEYSVEDTGETLLTSVLITYLKGAGYNVTSDAHTRGHVDITVQSRKLNAKWLGEAKKHGAYDHLVEGMKQLLHRYSTGTETDGGMFVYVFNKDAKSVRDEWKQAVGKYDAGEPPALSLDATDARFRFTSTHKHDSGYPIAVRHHIVQLHHEPVDKSARASAVARNATAARYVTGSVAAKAAENAQVASIAKPMTPKVSAESADDPAGHDDE